jgi:hypothetical protein
MITKIRLDINPKIQTKDQLIKLKELIVIRDIDQAKEKKEPEKEVTNKT